MIPITSKKSTERKITNAAQARVRYVGGYCIAKLHYKYLQKKRSTMYQTDKADMFQEAVTSANILDSLRVQEQDTSMPETMLDISRRQNQNRSLTNIPDSLYHFYCSITEQSLKLLVDENLKKHGENMFEYSKNTLVENKNLYHQFYTAVKDSSQKTVDIFNRIIDNQDFEKHIHIIYTKLIKIFLMVMINQFRKDILDNFQIKKKMSHRKQILVSTKGKGEKKPGKKKPCKKSSKKSPSVIDIDQPSTSSQVETRKRKNVSDSDNSTVEENDDVLCLVCNKNTNFTNKGGIANQWIQCDKCEGWIHRSCAGLSHHLKWKKAQSEGSVFLCKQCE